MRVSPFVLTALLALSPFLRPAAAEAEIPAAGAHFGINLDRGHPQLGADVFVPLLDLSDAVSLAIWPAYTHVFLHEQRDVELIEGNLVVSFATRLPTIRPYAGGGLGLSFHHDTSLKLNMLGGARFAVHPRVVPFVQLAIRTINGTFVDAAAGVLFPFGG